MPETLKLRRAGEADLAAIAEIQRACREAAQWDVRDYLAYDFVAAVYGESIAGFAVARRLADGESELLNVAVDPAFRRRGIARCLLRELTTRHNGTLWLEVRESNAAARGFYKSFGFNEIEARAEYYGESGETAIVMNFHS
jgi:ribosomal-protein-alanine acetyltransferase